MRNLQVYTMHRPPFAIKYFQILYLNRLPLHLLIRRNGNHTRRIGTMGTML
jgi:hypothetical protein